MSYLEQIGHYKGARKPKEFGDGKNVTQFYIDIDKDEKYPRWGEFKVFNDKIELDKFEIGDEVIVRFGISAREWERPTDKKKMIFQDLVAFSMSHIQTSKAKDSNPEPDISDNNSDKDLPQDDLPFVITILLAIGSIVNMLI